MLETCYKFTEKFIGYRFPFLSILLVGLLLNWFQSESSAIWIIDLAQLFTNMGLTYAFLMPVALILKVFCLTKLRQQSFNEAAIQTLKAFIPTFLHKWLRVELTLQSAFLRSLKREKIKAQTDPTHISFNTSLWKQIVYTICALVIAEIIVVHLFLHYAFQAPIWLHIVLLYLSIMLVVYLIGELRILNESSHVLGLDHFHIKLGIRYETYISFSNVAAMEPVQVSSLEIGRKHPDASVITVFESPNLLITLYEEIPIKVLNISEMRTKKLLIHLENSEPIMRSFERWKQQQSVTT